jgi:hypothetical protein
MSINFCRKKFPSGRSGRKIDSTLGDLALEEITMANEPSPRSGDVADVAAVVPPRTNHIDGLAPEGALDAAEKIVDEIEMIGEEVAAGYRPPGHSPISPGLRYLHSSRTIHQLVTDRNRAVGVYMAVATLLWTASAALLNANPAGEQILPLALIQKWCLPFTFAVMTVLAVFAGLLLVRTRVGLIYEVAKMNVLLGLPVGRVSRISPLSIFFILQALISLAGGCSAAMCSAYFLRLAGVDPGHLALPAVLIGLAIGVGLMLLYIFSVVHITSDKKLQDVGK